MKTHYETIVVGTGAAGMNCCLELQKNDREYLLISPNIGGRICNDELRRGVLFRNLQIYAPLRAAD